MTREGALKEKSASRKPVTKMIEKYQADSERIARQLIDMAGEIKKEDGVCLIFLHKSVDGDCVGSACGLCEALRRIGVEAYVAMPEELPENMNFLGVSGLLFDVSADTDVANAFRESGMVFDRKFTRAIAVDISESDRMGACGEFFDKCPNKIIIDHHASVSTRAENMWIDPDASSACELVYYVVCSMAKLLGRPVSALADKLCAGCLIAGIVTDTGRFTYKNTRPETLVSAGELMALGGDISAVCYNLFDVKKQSKFRLSAAARSKAEFLCGGQFALSVVPYSMFREYGADADGVDDVVSALRDVDSVEVAIVLRELENGEIRGNVRSQE
jgi:phosphoesterase RecJ-like protein